MRKVTLFLALFISCFSVQAQEKKLTKQEALDYIEFYYSDFETSSNEYDNSLYGIKVKSGYSRPVRKFTANYKAEFKDCKFKMTYDNYRWPYDEKRDINVIEFNLYEIDSIQRGPDLILDIPGESGMSVDVNSSISFKLKSGNKAVFIQKDDKEELVKYEDEVNLKMHAVEFPSESSPTEIIKLIAAFDRLREFCITGK